MEDQSPSEMEPAVVSNSWFGRGVRWWKQTCGRNVCVKLSPIAPLIALSWSWQPADAPKHKINAQSLSQIEVKLVSSSSQKKQPQQRIIKYDINLCRTYRIVGVRTYVSNTYYIHVQLYSPRSHETASWFLLLLSCMCYRIENVEHAWCTDGDFFGPGANTDAKSIGLRWEKGCVCVWGGWSFNLADH